MEQFKKLWPVAVLIWLLSLPIMLWRSSRLGKLVYLALLILIISKCINPVTNMYFNLTSISQVRQKTKSIFEGIDKLRHDLQIAQDSFSGETEFIEKKIDANIKSSKEAITNHISGIEEQLNQIEKDIDIIKESERDALKERIIRLREDVKVHNKSIEDSNIRLQCEFISKKLYLLTAEEKERFDRDLEAIGFEVKRIDKYSTMYSSVNYAITSADACTTVFSNNVSSDSAVSYVSYRPTFRRGRNGEFYQVN